MSAGVSYFPKHWPSERWERDVEQMAAAGPGDVRTAEFSWGRLEPGEFDFAWFDETVTLGFEEASLYLFDVATGDALKTETEDTDVAVSDYVANDPT